LPSPWSETVEVDVDVEVEDDVMVVVLVVVDVAVALETERGFGFWIATPEGMLVVTDVAVFVSVEALNGTTGTNCWPSFFVMVATDAKEVGTGVP
jgi:hypothetical protein